MMPESFENPFANYGNIISGSHFLGRRDSLRVIDGRIIRPRESGNLAIVGLHAIGKSSLIYHAIIERQKELIDKKFLPLRVNLATYSDTKAFFLALVSLCHSKLKELGWLDVSINEAANVVSRSRNRLYLHIQNFFAAVHHSDIRILFILDEFDHARHLFKGDISGFQQLRELSSHPEWHVTFITASRRTIYDIEIQTQAISTLDGIFYKHYLGPFNEREIQEYFTCLGSMDIPLETSLIEKTQSYTGGHPYLLSVLGYEIVEIFHGQGYVDVDAAFQQTKKSFIDYYERIVRFLEEDGYLKKMLQILFGPTVDVKQVDVDTLLRFGIIKAGPNDTYVAFSPHFQSFLSLIARDIDLWSIWRETEKALRKTIAAVLAHTYGEEWFEKLAKKHKNMSVENGKNLFQRCRDSQQKEILSWGDRASRNLLDFTYPKDLLDIVQREWTESSFHLIFGKEKKYWEQRATLLAKVRNPLAHNRDEALYDDQRHLAEAYCREILDTLRRARENPAFPYLNE